MVLRKLWWSAMPPLSRAGKHETCTRRWNWCQARETRNWNATWRNGIQCQALQNVPKLSSVDWILFCQCIHEKNATSFVKLNLVRERQNWKTTMTVENGSVPLFDSSGYIICKKIPDLKISGVLFWKYYFRTLFISFRIKTSNTLQKLSLSRWTPTKDWNNICENDSFTLAVASWL